MLFYAKNFGFVFIWALGWRLLKKIYFTYVSVAAMRGAQQISLSWLTASRWATVTQQDAGDIEEQMGEFRRDRETKPRSF